MQYFIAIILLALQVIARPEFADRKIYTQNEQCYIAADNRNVGQITISEDLLGNWAKAGVNENPDYLCIDIVRPQYSINILYKEKLANQITSRFSKVQGGCDFSYGNCTDPIIRQQIIDAGLCYAFGRPQQIVDRFMLTLNRPDWLYVIPANHITAPAVDLENIHKDGNFLQDDNLCSFRIAIGWLMVATKIDVQHQLK